MKDTTMPTEGSAPTPKVESTNHQNSRKIKDSRSETSLTPLNLEQIFLHANSQLCSSRVALFQANFMFFVIFLNFGIDDFKLFGRPGHRFAHLDYMGGAPP